MKNHPLILATLLVTATPLPIFAIDLHWDRNGNAPGASTIPNGTWDASTPNWNSSADGIGDPGTLLPFTFEDTAIFSAGSDATGPFTVTLNGTQQATGVTIEEGTVIFTGPTPTAGGQANVGTGTVQINAGATLSLNTSLRLGGSAGSRLFLNGGTIIQTNPSNAGSFIPTSMNLEIGAAGGTVNYTSSGSAAVSIYSGTITGTGTLTKTGPHEFRYQNIGTAGTTFTKLVVNEGLYRLGSVTVGTPPVQQTSELGFGAAPAVFTPDAITLNNGGSIGASFTITLDANRGITLGPGGGAINPSAAGTITVPGAVTGSGSFTKELTNTVVFGGTNTYTGATILQGGTLALGSATLANGSILTTPRIDSTNGTLSMVNTAGNADRVGDTTPTTLRVGGVSLTGNGTVDTTEVIGPVALEVGGHTFTVASAAGRVTTLAPASINRGTQNATALVRGSNLNQSAGTNVARIIPGDAEASFSFVGTNTLSGAPTNDATQAVRIIPYLFGDTSTTGTGNGFVTYDTMLGLRVLTAAQSTVLTPAYTTAANPDNARVTADLTLTDVAPITVNSLIFAGAAATTLATTSAQPLTVNSGAVGTTGAFDYTINGTFGGLNLGNGEGVITVAANTLTVGTPISVTSNGGLTKAGPGTLNLPVANSYTGPTTINGGIVVAGNAAALGTGSVRHNGVRLAVADGVTLPNAITIGPNLGIAGRGLIEPASGTATVSGPIAINNNAFAGGHFSAPVGTTLNVAGAITAPPAVTVTSRLGDVTFSGGGSYSTLQIQAGNAFVGATNGIATNAVVDVASSDPGTLDLNGFDQTLAGLARTSTTAGRNAQIINNAAPKTLTLNVTGQVAYAGTVASGTTTGDATITGGISLVKNGAGTQALSGGGANSYIGSTTVNAGILKLQKASGADTIPGGNAVAVNSGGTLQLGARDQISDGITDFVINGGTFDLGAFSETVVPTVTLTNGSITGTSAGFFLTLGGYLASGTNTISKGLSSREFDPNSGRFDVVNGTTTVSGVIENDDSTAGGLTKVGAGTLVLSATNSYIGLTDVTAGTLEFRADQVLTGLNIGAGATARIASDSAAAALPAALVFTEETPVAAVPEPGALCLLAAGALGLLSRRRR